MYDVDNILIMGFISFLCDSIYGDSFFELQERINFRGYLGPENGIDSPKVHSHFRLEHGD